MPVSFNCHCLERKKPIKERNWIVKYRHINHSYFQSPRGQPHYSDYSHLECLACGAQGRTKAKFVDQIVDQNEGKIHHSGVD